MSILLVVLILLVGCVKVNQPTTTQDEIGLAEEDLVNTKTAIFAGGCFWCMEAPFEAQAGVIDVVAGYTGGTEEEATYELVSSGTTEHREAIRVTYDPEQVSYEQLVELYFWQIDPTDSDGQFADKGYQYTTAVYYFDEEQQQIALDHIKTIDQSGMFARPVVTQVLPAQEFYEAEDYHQDYYKKQTTAYETYSTLSGRKGFIKKYWGDN